jgi:NAD(P)-dependent dehydrogenase (short-subunit alcohol dehydrogenase family)
MSNFLQLTDKRIVVFGMANRKSVAAHVGQVLTEVGAKVIHVVRSEERREQVRSLVRDLPIHMCDVEQQEQIARVRDEIGSQHGPITRPGGCRFTKLLAEPFCRQSMSRAFRSSRWRMRFGI